MKQVKLNIALVIGMLNLFKNDIFMYLFNRHFTVKLLHVHVGNNVGCGLESGLAEEIVKLLKITYEKRE